MTRHIAAAAQPRYCLVCGPRARRAEAKEFGLEPYEHDALTVEGQIERETALLAGAKRVGGWRKWVVYGFYLVAGVMLVWTLVAQLLGPFLLDLD